LLLKKILPNVYTIQNPRSEGWRFAPPLTSWVLYSHHKEKAVLFTASSLWFLKASQSEAFIA
jgi:hypothetical protein